MTLPISIRPMQEADIPQVQAIDRASFTMPWPQNAYQYELKENLASRLWVANAEPHPRTGAQANESQKTGDLVVGVIVVWIILDEAHIATLAVHPDYRREGIGAELLACALKEAIQRGLSVATLEVRAQNLAAQNLYEKFHFAVVGRRPRYYRDNNEDAIIMTTHRFDTDYLNWLESRGWVHRPADNFY